MKIETRKGKWLISAVLLWLAFAPLAQAFYNPSTGRGLNQKIPQCTCAFRKGLANCSYEIEDLLKPSGLSTPPRGGIWQAK